MEKEQVVNYQLDAYFEDSREWRIVYDGDQLSGAKRKASKLKSDGSEVGLFRIYRDHTLHLVGEAGTRITWKAGRPINRQEANHGGRSAKPCKCGGEPSWHKTSIHGFCITCSSPSCSAMSCTQSANESIRRWNKMANQ